MRTRLLYIVALVACALTIVPPLWALYVSFSVQTDAGPGLGFENYRDVLSQGQFWGSLWNSFLTAFLSTLVSIVLGAVFLGLALNVHKIREGREADRAAKRLFSFSIFYLFALFAALLIERGVALWVA